MKGRQMWTEKEHSTRNCVHAHVISINGKPHVSCKKRQLANFYRGNFGCANLHTVLTSNTLVKACVGCEYFEHDVEVV